MRFFSATLRQLGGVHRDPPGLVFGGTPYFYVANFPLPIDADQSKQPQRSYRSAVSRKHQIHDMTALASETNEVLYQALGVQRLLSQQDVIRLLRSEVERAGSQRAFARKAGVNVSVVSKTLRGMLRPPEKILRALKLRIVYLGR